LLKGYKTLELATERFERDVILQDEIVLQITFDVFIEFLKYASLSNCAVGLTAKLIIL
jgi:hypothetical protein